MSSMEMARLAPGTARNDGHDVTAPPRRMPRMPESPSFLPVTTRYRPAHPGDDRKPNRDAKWRSSHFHRSYGLDRSCRPPRLLSFRDGQRLRKAETEFKTGGEKM